MPLPWSSAALLVSSSAAVIAGILVYWMTKRWHQWKDTRDTSRGHGQDKSAVERYRCTLQSPSLLETTHIQIVLDWTACDRSVACLGYGGQPVVVGMDCEWVSDRSKQGKVALLQLSTLEHCVLVRLCCLQDGVPDCLRRFLENERIIKVGVAVCDDAKRLMSDYGVATRGCVDLRKAVIRCSTESDQRWILNRGVGLQSLADTILHVNLDKSPHVRRSDWEAEQLSTEQILYAANDAYISLRIFEQLVKETVAQQTGVSDIWKEAVSWCDSIVDVPYKAPRRKQMIQMESGCMHQPSGSDRSVVQRRTNPLQCRQKPLYYNCQLLAPDGELLCTCDQKKIQWYIDRKLGEVVSESPLTLRLKFEPAARPDDSRRYYMTAKQNICVVCGRAESYLRKHIIPHEYRQHFPAERKEHICHDVLLLCTGCHQASDMHDNLLRRKLAAQYNAPLSTAKHTQDRQLSKVRMAASALTQHKDKIPSQRKEELEQVVKDHYQIVSINDEILMRAASLHTSVPNTQFVSHGQKVVEAVTRQGTLQEFERMWRQHFLDTVRPRFLPQLWSVTHNQQA